MEGKKSFYGAVLCTFGLSASKHGTGLCKRVCKMVIGDKADVQ